MLAQLVRANSPTSVVPTIATEDGKVTLYTPEILDKFKAYYEDLYSSRQNGMWEGMDSFFRGLSLPFLFEMDRAELDRPITLEEMQRITNEMAKQKSPGQDGLPAEIYLHYGKVFSPSC